MLFLMVSAEDRHRIKFIARLGLNDLTIVDAAVSAAANVLDVVANFRARAFNDHLHATVGKIFDPAGNGILDSRFLAGVAKANTLDATIEKDVPANVHALTIIVDAIDFTRFAF